MLLISDNFFLISLDTAFLADLYFLNILPSRVSIYLATKLLVHLLGIYDDLGIAEVLLQYS